MHPPDAIPLTPTAAEATYLQSKLAAGEFASAADVLHAPLAIMQKWEASLDPADHARLVELRQLTTTARTQLDAGQAIPFDPEDLKRAGRRELDNRRMRLT